MSADYSHYERDQYRRSNRRHEYRTTVTYSQKVYEPKSSDKNLKEHEQQDNSSQNHNDYDNYDHYPSRNDRHNNYNSRDNRYNNHGAYRQRGYQRDRRDGNHRIGYWIKEAVPVNKEKSEATPTKSKETQEQVPEKTKEFVKEKQSPSNKENVELNTEQPEDRKLRHMSSGGSTITSGSTSTDSSETRKIEEIYDSPPKKAESLEIEEKENYESDDEKNENLEKEEVLSKNKGEERSEQPLSEKTEVKEDVFEDKNVKPTSQIKDGEEKECQETDESDGEKYSNIDELVEKKLMNNEFEEQVFDDFGNEIKKEDLEAIVSDERPLWEDLDTKKVLEDIQKEEYLFMLPQDIKSWANKEWEKIGNKQNERAMTNKDQESENTLKFDFNYDDDDEEYDRIFSLRKFERGFSRPKVEINPAPAMSNSGYDAYVKDYCGTAAVHANPAFMENTNSGLLGPKSANLPVFRSQHIQTPYTAHQVDYDIHAKSSRLPQGNGFNIETPRSSMTPSMGNFSQVDFPKFIFKRFSPDYDAQIWYYIDAYEMIQGPFSGRVMDDWLIRGCLPHDLRVALEGSAEFSSLKDLAELYSQELSQSFNGNDNAMNPNNFYASGSPSIRSQNASFSPPERTGMTAFQNQQACPPTTNMSRKSPLSPQCVSNLYIPFESLPNQCKPLVKDDRSPEGLESPVLNVTSLQREDSRPRGLMIPKNYNKSKFDENYSSTNPEPFYQETRQKCSPLNVRNNNFLNINSNVNNAFVPTIPKKLSPQSSTVIRASAPNTPFANVMSANKLTQPFTPTYRIQPATCLALDQLQEFAWKAVINDDDIIESGEVSRTQ